MSNTDNVQSKVIPSFVPTTVSSLANDAAAAATAATATATDAATAAARATATAIVIFIAIAIIIIAAVFHCKTAAIIIVPAAAAAAVAAAATVTTATATAATAATAAATAATAATTADKAVATIYYSNKALCDNVIEDLIRVFGNGKKITNKEIAKKPAFIAARNIIMIFVLNNTNVDKYWQEFSVWVHFLIVKMKMNEEAALSFLTRLFDEIFPKNYYSSNKEHKEIETKMMTCLIKSMCPNIKDSVMIILSTLMNKLIESLHIGSYYDINNVLPVINLQKHNQNNDDADEEDEEVKSLLKEMFEKNSHLPLLQRTFVMIMNVLGKKQYDIPDYLTDIELYNKKIHETHELLKAEKHSEEQRDENAKQKRAKKERVLLNLKKIFEKEYSFGRPFYKLLLKAWLSNGIPGSFRKFELTGVFKIKTVEGDEITVDAHMVNGCTIKFKATVEGDSITNKRYISYKNGYNRSLPHLSGN